MSELNPELIHALHTALLRELGGEALYVEDAERVAYGIDNSRQHAMPHIVVLPESHQQVVTVLRLCSEYRVPVTSRGRGTGTTGAAVPIAGGVVVSTERMARIVDIDAANRMAIVEPGVTNQALQLAAADAGFFWPPDPTSSPVCTVGGNLACNAAGPRAVKYGTPRENTLGLRAVTADGRELRTGVYTTKGVVGYDLTRLLIGSEGTLALITEATLKLTPLAEAVQTLRAYYRDINSAAEAVSRIMAQPVTPSALEFIDGNAIAMIRDYSEYDLPDDVGAMLMIEVDGAAACIDQASDAVARAAKGDGCVELEVARTDEETRQLWATRKALSPALRTIAPKKINEDVVVPVAAIPELIRGLDALARKYEVTIVNFGHAGNGNIHVNLLVDPDDPEQMAAAEPCLQEVFELVLKLRGTLSGEHGIGLVKRPYVSLELDATSLALMHGIKSQFDPHGILNPGKTIPELH